MAKYTLQRRLNRSTAHRGALLRNLVTSLFEHESISTTWPKAKEAQRLAEKCVTLAKKGTEAAKISAGSIFYNPEIIPKLFGPIAERYKNRSGGYTRIHRIEPLKTDQAPSAILELVDGPRDMRFALVAATIAKCSREDKEINKITHMNIKKVTQFRNDGTAQLEKMVEKLKATRLGKGWKATDQVKE